MSLRAITLALFTTISGMVCTKVAAQITMGSNHSTLKGSLLDLKEFSSNNATTSTKGLALPRVKLALKTGDLGQSMEVEKGSLDAKKHIGLMVFNTDQNLCQYRPYRLS